MEYQIETSGDVELLKLSGELTIQYTAKLHGVLLEMVHRGKTIRIQIDHATDVDLTCLQLLCSAHKTAAEYDKNLSLDSRSEVFNQRIKEAGFTRTKGCTPETEKSCLWIGGVSHE
jgi:anti-anti-sigma regulatory factor